jgi:hypothetical protein
VKNADHPQWEPQPDGSRTKISDGIRITVRPARAEPRIEHLITWQERRETRILGLDASCTPVYETAFTNP